MVGSGNSTFCKNSGVRRWKTPINQDLYLYSILKTKKRKPFFNFQSPLWKLEKSAPFSHEKPEIFRICLLYIVKQVSWVIFISYEWQKSWKKTGISQVLSTFWYGQRTLPRRRVEICSCRRPLVRLLKVLDVLKASIWWWNYLLFFEGNVRRSPGLDRAQITRWPLFRVEDFSLTLFHFLSI